MREAGIWQSLKILARAIVSPRHKLLKRKHTIYYNMLPNLLWSYVEDNDPEGNLNRLVEPLHEMRMDQIQYFFGEIERLTRNYFYFKQWKETTVPIENETITESDYPIGKDWTLIMRQQCKVQAKFFEAIYSLPD